MRWTGVNSEWLNQHSQREAKRDISSVNFIVTLTGLEIDTILTAVGVTTSMWAKNRRQMPGSFDLAPLSSGCDKLMNPVEEDYQQRCASHDVFRSERERAISKFADLIHTESVRLSPAMVDMVYSYRVAQIIEELRQAGEP